MRAWSTISVEMTEEEREKAAKALDFLDDLRIAFNKVGANKSESDALGTTIQMLMSLLDTGTL